jgi:hypothetical protein
VIASQLIIARLRRPFASFYRWPAQPERSGLGLEAQREAIRRFTESEGLKLASEYVAVVVAKLDRLSRDVAFIASLMRHVSRSWWPS